LLALLLDALAPLLAQLLSFLALLGLRAPVLAQILPLLALLGALLGKPLSRWTCILLPNAPLDALLPLQGAPFDALLADALLARLCAHVSLNLPLRAHRLLPRRLDRGPHALRRGALHLRARLGAWNRPLRGRNGPRRRSGSGARRNALASLSLASLRIGR
jgi:hypothetical protein